MSANRWACARASGEPRVPMRTVFWAAIRGRPCWRWKRSRRTSAAAMAQDIVTVLGIETSCDETAAAIVRLSPEGVSVLAERVASQVEEHAAYGGVVPEIAARAHVERLDGLIRGVMEESGLGWDDVT